MSVPMIHAAWAAISSNPHGLTPSTRRIVVRLAKVRLAKFEIGFVHSLGVTRGAYQCHEKRPRKYVGRLIDRGKI